MGLSPMDTYLFFKVRRLLAAASLGLLTAFLAAPSGYAQGLAAKDTIDTIVDAEVETTDETATAREQRVIAAIENSRDNAAQIRKRVSVDNLKIVFLHGFGPDCADTASRSAINAKLEDFATDITAMREAIQGSAIFYHAVDSRSVLLNDIVAVEFGQSDDVTVMVASTKC